MDGQATTREEIDAMFSKVTAVFDHIRNVFLNESELSKRVEQMQAQINELSMQVHQVTANNSALQEAVNVLTSERDEWRKKFEQSNVTAASLEMAREKAQNDADYWYNTHLTLTQEHEKVKSERSQLEQDHLKLMEEHEKVKAELERITAQINQVYLGLQPRPIEPLQSHESQPRDPATQRWQPFPEAQSA